MAFRILLDGVERRVEILRRRPHLVLAIDGREHVVQGVGHDADGLDDITVSGQPLHVARASSTAGLTLRALGRTFEAALTAPGEDAEGGNAGSELRAPMPGAVVDLHAAVGDAVKAGDALVTIESMKLQTVLAAPRDGIVAGVSVAAGDGFDKDQVLVWLQEEGTPENA